MPKFFSKQTTCLPQCRKCLRKDVLVREGITCLHAENPQAPSIVLKWRKFQKLILLSGPEETRARLRKKCHTLTLVLAGFYAKRIRGDYIRMNNITLCVNYNNLHKGI